MEIWVIQVMGYCLNEIGQEFGLSRTRLENLMIVERRISKDKEVAYPFKVLEVVQAVQVEEDEFLNG